MEKVEQPNDIHEQNMRYFQFDLLFRSRPKCPEHDLEPPDAIKLILTLLVEQTKVRQPHLARLRCLLEAAGAKHLLFFLCARLTDDSQDYRFADQSALPMAR
jgi:hypothetical protein